MGGGGSLNGLEISINSKEGKRELSMKASEEGYENHVMNLDIWSLGYGRIRIGRFLSQPLLQSNLRNWRPDAKTMEDKAEMDETINIPDLLTGSSLDVSVAPHLVHERITHVWKVQCAENPKAAYIFYSDDNEEQVLVMDIPSISP